MLGEPDDAEVRLVDAQQRSRALADRPLVVGKARSVRRPDLHERRAGACEDVRDAEPVADLDQLAAGDDHLAPLAESCEREQDCGRVVVDDERSFGARQLAEQRGDVVLPRPACSRPDVVFEVGVACADLLDPGEGRFGQRRAAEVRVDDDAGGVEHASQPGREACLELQPRPRDEVAGGEARAHVLAGTLQRGPGSREHLRTPVALGERRELLVSEQLVDRRKLSERVRGHVPPDDRGRVSR